MRPKRRKDCTVARRTDGIWCEAVFRVPVHVWPTGFLPIGRRRLPKKKLKKKNKKNTRRLFFFLNRHVRVCTGAPLFRVACNDNKTLHRPNVQIRRKR